jgi:hypothetical protein
VIDRDVLLQRLAGRGGPVGHDLDAAWQRLPEHEQRRLRRTATDPDAARHLDDDLARTLVDALAADRVARRTWDLAVPVVTALLVLSTVWGFGRAAFPDVAEAYLVVGLLGALVTTVVGWRRRADARHRAHGVRRVLRGLRHDSGHP